MSKSEGRELERDEDVLSRLEFGNHNTSFKDAASHCIAEVQESSHSVTKSAILSGSHSNPVKEIGRLGGSEHPDDDSLAAANDRFGSLNGVTLSQQRPERGMDPDSRSNSVKSFKGPNEGAATVDQEVVEDPLCATVSQNEHCFGMPPAQWEVLERDIHEVCNFLDDPIAKERLFRHLKAGKYERVIHWIAKLKTMMQEKKLLWEEERSQVKRRRMEVEKRQEQQILMQKQQRQAEREWAILIVLLIILIVQTV